MEKIVGWSVSKLAYVLEKVMGFLVNARDQEANISKKNWHQIFPEGYANQMQHHSVTKRDFLINEAEMSQAVL